MNHQLYMTTPPVFDTDVPTNETFYTENNGRQKTGSNRRYAGSQLGIVAMEQAPIGHGQQSQGTWIAHLTNGSLTQSAAPVLRLAFHPNAGTSQAMSYHWSHYDAIIAQLPQPGSNFVGNRRIYAALGAQRLGNYLYVLTWASQTVSGTTTGHYQVLKYGPNGNAIVYQGDTTSAGANAQQGIPTSPFPGLDLPVDFAVNPASGYTETFVSDDATPFLWHTSGNLCNIGAAWVVGFKDDGSELGTRASTTNAGDLAPVYFTGQLGAYAQVYVPQTTRKTFGPYLVFPWSSGKYGPPELWWLVQVGDWGSTFDIYRSQWRRGNYRSNAAIVVADDETYLAGRRRYPALNPEGFAFTHDWFQSEHKVGRVGPFPGAEIDNGAASSPPPGLMQNAYFKIMRDPHRIGQMHIVLVNADLPITDDPGQGTVTT